MRRFKLHRYEDHTGISGTGEIAEGCHFQSGKAVLVWLTAYSSVAVYDSMSDLMAIHGHEGKTQLIYID